MSARRIVVTAVAIAVIVAAAASAGLAFGPGGGTESGQVSLPPDGNGTAETSTLPPTATQSTIGVTADSPEAKFFSGVTAYITAKPTLTARVVGCAKIYTGLVTGDESEKFTVDEPTLQLLFLHVCIQMAIALSSNGLRTPSSAAGTCKVRNEAIPVRISRSGGGFKAVVNGKPFTPKTRQPFVLSCKRTAQSLSLSLKPRSKAATLAQVMGPSLGIGFSNAGSASGNLKFAFTVK